MVQYKDNKWAVGNEAFFWFGPIMIILILGLSAPYILNQSTKEKVQSEQSQEKQGGSTNIVEQGSSDDSSMIMKNNPSNQRLEPIVKPPLDEVEAQSTQTHP